MKKLTALLSVSLLLSVVVTSCRRPKELAYQGVQNFHIKQAGFKKTVLSMDVRLYNPNPYKMKLKNAALELYVNNNRVGNVGIDKKIKVPRADTFSMPIMLDVNLSNALPNMLQLAFNSEVDVRLTGKVKAGRHGIFITVPVNYSGKQDIREGLKW